MLKKNRSICLNQIIYQSGYQVNKTFERFINTIAVLLKIHEILFFFLQDLKSNKKSHIYIQDTFEKLTISFTYESS